MSKMIFFRASRSCVRRCSLSMAVIWGSLTWPLLRGWSGAYNPYSTVSGFPGVADRSQGQTLELTEIRRRHIGAVLLDLQFRLDANLFERALGQLCSIDDLGTRTRPTSGMEQCFEALRNASFRQQAPGFLGIVLIVARARAEFINARRPFGQAT